MSERATNQLPRVFRPYTLMGGVLAGMFLLAWAGRVVSRDGWHHDFQRFHPLIAPESLYQPTVGEMRSIVRARCRPDQILVIVGGNSIFQGVGQPVEELWSRHLQALLGPEYAVVNLAFRGSSPTDGGALAAESLRTEFPRQIYLANVPPFVGASPAGNLDYRFMLFDALYKGWLLPHAPRQATLEDYFARPDIYPAGSELDRCARLDAIFRFRDFWNWWSVCQFSTFPSPLTPSLGLAFRPRRAFGDAEPDFEDIPFSDRYAPRFLPNEMAITRNTTAPFYSPHPAGGWTPSDFERQQFRKITSAAFPDPLKARTLIVLSRNSPYYTQRLSEAERERDDLAFRDSILIWRETGYAATEYGRDFHTEDFGDRTHLTASGGRKLAAILAPEIRDLAAKLSYLKP